ncbi:MAG: Rrf2 family transcriptional regulator [Bacteroidales bacterium]|nr:Rrf2 family transcriptional regulator [Bacteroidales bacterium]
MGSIVKFSEAASIAIHGVILVAKSEKFLNVTKIAEALDASRHHVAKVMQRLAKDGFIKSMRGPTGGFVLTKKSEEISFLDLYESTEGKITIEECPFNRLEICTFEKCILNNITPKMTKDFIRYMEKQFISDYI